MCVCVCVCACVRVCVCTGAKRGVGACATVHAWHAARSCAPCVCVCVRVCLPARMRA